MAYQSTSLSDFALAAIKLLKHMKTKQFHPKNTRLVFLTSPFFEYSAKQITHMPRHLVYTICYWETVKGNSQVTVVFKSFWILFCANWNLKKSFILFSVNNITNNVLCDILCFNLIGLYCIVKWLYIQYACIVLLQSSLLAATHNVWCSFIHSFMCFLTPKITTKIIIYHPNTSDIIMKQKIIFYTFIQMFIY